MSLYRLITPILSYCFILVIIFPCLPTGAQTQDEMIVLSLFYEEKDLVVTPTRYAKPISQVAENISVITKREIEEMNAHTVAEILNRVPGLYVGSSQDFGAASLLYIQGSEQRHVLVLVDGIPWNYLSEGGAETNSIPVGTIDRIEVIKGPASSAWGSSLGGVVNILTKPTGHEQGPSGSIRASFGEKNSQDYRAQVSGMAGPVGYYLFAGRQDSDGLRDARYFENYSLYGKFHLPVSDYVEANLSMGYSHPDMKLGDLPSSDITANWFLRSFFAAASMEAFLARGLSLKVSYHTLKQESQQTNTVLDLGMIGPPGELFLESVFDEETTGGRVKLVWEKGRHTAVLGVDFDQGKLDQTLNAGPYLQDYWGVQASSATYPKIDRRAVYVNDTILIGEWSLTPGIRVDDNRITGSFVSPSLGLTFKLGKESLFSASATRGFTIPPLSSLSGGGLFVDPNPALKPEQVWSFQAGIESGALKYLWVRATLFRHDLDNALTKAIQGEAPPPASNYLIINDGEVRRQGLELEFQTLPFHHLSLQAGFSYVDISPSNESGAEETYAWNISLKYDDKASFRAELFGRFVVWDVAPVYNASYDDFIWELNLNKRIFSGKGMNAEIFLTAHNLFDGAQFSDGDYRNPQTWVEAGIRLKF